MFKLIVLSGAVALLAACSSMPGGREWSSSMGASGASSAVYVDPDYNTSGSVAMRRGGPLGALGSGAGGPN